MKKLLYIVASSKPESLSSCQRGARIFLNCFLEQHPEYVIEEINVFHDAIPQPNDHHFLSRATLVNGDRFRQLSEQDQNIVNRMQQLCDQFKSADHYVIAAPMWTLSFPYKLKQYLDCLILNDQTISISPKGVKGLLHTKKRKAIYIQSSADIYPFKSMSIPFVGTRVNHGITYLYDVFRFLGIECIEPLLIQGTEIDDSGIELALAKASGEVAHRCEAFK